MTTPRQRRVTRELSSYWHPSITLENRDIMGVRPLTRFGELTETADGWNMGTSNTAYLELLAGGGFAQASAFSWVCWAKPDVTAMNLNLYGGWVLNDRLNDYGRDDFQLIYAKTLGLWVANVWNTERTVFRADLGVPINNAWQHLAFTAGGGVLTAYLNGVGTETPYTGTLNNRSNEFRIGDSWDQGTGNGKYHGSLDNLRYYTRVLSVAEIQTLYHAGRQ